MASRIAGITIEIGGDTTKLQKSIKGLDSSLKNTKNELKDIDKLLRFNPANTDLLRQKQERLASAISDTEKRLSELKAAQSGVKKGTKEWDALQREIIATEGDLKNLKKQQREFGNVASQVLKVAGQKMKDFGGKVQDVGKKLQPLSTAATGVLTAIGGMAYKAVQSADDLNTLAKQTGFTTDEIQKLQYASDFVDVSFDDMASALKKLKPKITENNETLQKLNVSTKNVDGSTRDATDVFYDAVAALGNVANETERDQLAMELFGKGADELAGIIDDGGAALKRYTKEAEDLGVVMDGETLDSLNNINDVIDRLKKEGGAALTKLGSTFATAFAPALEKVKGILEKVTDAISKLTPAQAETILKITAIVAAIAPLVTIVGKVISLCGSIVSIIGTIVGVLGGPLTIAIAAVVAAGVLLYKNWDTIKAYAIKLKDGIVNAWNNVKTATTNAWNNVKTSVSNAWTNVKTATTTALNTLKTNVNTGLDAVKKKFVENGGGIKGAAAAAMEGVKQYFKIGFSTLDSLAGGKLTEVKDKIGGVFSNMAKTISGKMAEIRSYLSIKNVPAFDTINSSIKTVVDKLTGLAKTVFSKLGEIKSYFKFNWSLPHIKIPHFSISGGVPPYGFLGKGSLPKINVSWYKGAYDNPVLFTQPTVLQTPQGAKGFGDGAGAEIVMGLNKLKQLVGASGDVTINVYATAGQDVNELADLIQRRFVALQKQREAAYA